MARCFSSTTIPPRSTAAISGRRSAATSSARRICYGRVEIAARGDGARRGRAGRSEEHTSELQSLMRISYAVFRLKKKTNVNYQRLAENHNYNPDRQLPSENKHTTKNQ